MSKKLTVDSQASASQDSPKITNKLKSKEFQQTVISYRIDKLWDDRINCFVTEDIAMQSSLKTDRNYSVMYAHNKFAWFSFERRKVIGFASTTPHD